MTYARKFYVMVCGDMEAGSSGKRYESVLHSPLSVMFALELGTPMADLADVREDEIGLRFGKKGCPSG